MTKFFSNWMLNFQRPKIQREVHFHRRIWTLRQEYLLRKAFNELWRKRKTLQNLKWLKRDAQWETLCSEGRRKPLNTIRYQKIIHHLKDMLYAVKHAKFRCNILTNAISTSKKVNVSHFANARLVPKRSWVRNSLERRCCKYC